MRMVEERASNMALMDYVLLPKQMHGRLLDETVCREGGGISDHLLVEASQSGGWIEE